MKIILNLAFLSLLSLWCFFAQAQSSNVTLIIVTNNPQGGTVSGGGTYASGASASVVIQALTGWYITNVVPVPQPAQLLTFQKLAILDGTNLTSITNDYENIILNSDTTLTVTFASVNQTLLPQTIQAPTNQTVLTGSAVTFTEIASGYSPLSYQWLQNSNPIAGATSYFLTLANVQATNDGNYSVTVTNIYGATNSTSATLVVKDLLVLTNGVPTNLPAITNLTEAVISIESRFTNGTIFYTLDGSTPDFGSISYSGAFTITTNSTLRAIAYSSDFSQTAMSDPVSITIIPTFSLWAGSSGGGTVMLNPSSDAYASNTVVMVTAVPAPGFTLMTWQGALGGTNLTNAVTVTSNQSVYAYFGTTLTTTTNGGGSITVFPAFSTYPYGTPVTLFAIPNSGNYFGLWGNAASGNQNPLSFNVATANPTVSALFGSLTTNEVSLTLQWDGGGTALVNPATNKCSMGTTVVVTAYADYGEQFLGWGGDASGTSNPLTMVMNSSKNIVAHFSHSPFLHVSPFGKSLQFEVAGLFGDIFTIQSSTGSFTNWVPILSVTNLYDAPVFFTDTVSSNATMRVYRAVAQ